jgi:hypothetical protein
MNLVLDLGNTFGKIAVCEGSRVIETAGYDKITSREIAYFHSRYPGIEAVIISSVINDSREIIHPSRWSTATGPRIPWGMTGSQRQWAPILFTREGPFW